MTQKLRLLIVDDDEETRDLLKQALLAEFGKEGNLSLVEAIDGMDASIKIERQAFDCVVTDFNMPKMTGEDFINFTRKSKLNAKVPIILITGFAKDFNANAHSFVSILEKPFKNSLLIEEIKNQIKQGSIDQRLNQKLLNLITEECNNYFKNILKTDVTIHKPAMRVAQQNLIGEVNIRMSFKAPYGEDLFFISLNKSLLEKAKTIFTEINASFANANELLIAKSIGKYILEQTKTADLLKHDNIQLQLLDSALNSDMAKSKELLQLRALYVSFESKEYKLCIYAIL